jgi:hypothetical protein
LQCEQQHESLEDIQEAWPSNDVFQMKSGVEVCEGSN